MRKSEPGKVRLLESSADDYIVMPFGMAELLARAQVVLRRTVRQETAEPFVRVGALRIDIARRLVSRDGNAVIFSPKQFALLRTLAVHHGHVLTHRPLMRELWLQEPVESVQYLRILMKKLRNRIESDPAQPIYIVTELAVGYRLRTQEQLDAIGYPRLCDRPSSGPWFVQSWTLNEALNNAGGLIRWSVILLLPVGFTLILAQGLSGMIERAAALRGFHQHE